ncbi:hypothetical protein [Nitrosopumilus sp.]|uniref:hypothetical protein n=1 Tax=Nitrosopumilus sp. TaxID=2024843 RepID=UPI00260DB0BF|nr:hypothetical protein [Nitrosopumilus sp.]
MAYLGGDAYSPIALDLENNFWTDFESTRTLSNVIQHFMQNFSYDDEEYRESFAIVIVQDQMIKKNYQREN